MEKDNKRTLILDKRSAKLKAESFCAYQERAQQEVRDKLYDWGLHQADVENIISELIADNFLSEQRFALSYAGGKFRIKQWGRIKIKQGLKQKQVSPKLIDLALASIDAGEYEQTLLKLIEKKAPLIKERDPFKAKQKLIAYLQGKGYEYNWILDILNNKKL